MTEPTVHRRHVLQRAAAAALALGMPVLPAARARAQAGLPYGGQLVFAVFRGGSQIGEHRYRFERRGNQLHVQIEVELQVKIGPITVFRYGHRNHEVWENDQLVAIETRTNDDGKPFEVKGRVTGSGFEVLGMNGTAAFPRSIMPSSYWHPASPKRSAFLDTQRGIPLDLNFAAGEREGVAVTDGQVVGARRHEVTGDLKVTAWYADSGAWAKLAFPARGSQIEYVMAVGTPVVP